MEWNVCDVRYTRGSKTKFGFRYNNYKNVYRKFENRKKGSKFMP